MASSVYRKGPKGIQDSCRILLQRQIKNKKKASSKAKINSLFYRKNILGPVLEEEISALYGMDNNKFEVHMDKVSSQATKSTATYLAQKESEKGIKCIVFHEINTCKITWCLANGLLRVRFFLNER